MMNVRDQFLIYFIKPIGMTGPIKIGISANPAQRLNDFKGWSPYELELIGAAPGNWDDEQFLHSGLAEFHTHGEWFLGSPEVIDAIEQVIASQGVAVLRDKLVATVNVRAKKVRATRSKRANDFIASQRENAA